VAVAYGASTAQARSVLSHGLWQAPCRCSYEKAACEIPLNHLDDRPVPRRGDDRRHSHGDEEHWLVLCVNEERSMNHALAMIRRRDWSLQSSSGELERAVVNGSIQILVGDVSSIAQLPTAPLLPVHSHSNGQPRRDSLMLASDRESSSWASS
jgi:hypothetical protein